MAQGQGTRLARGLLGFVPGTSWPLDTSGYGARPQPQAFYKHPISCLGCVTRPWSGKHLSLATPPSICPSRPMLGDLRFRVPSLPLPPPSSLLWSPPLLPSSPPHAPAFVHLFGPLQPLLPPLHIWGQPPTLQSLITALDNPTCIFGVHLSPVIARLLPTHSPGLKLCGCTRRACLLSLPVCLSLLASPFASAAAGPWMLPVITRLVCRRSDPRSRGWVLTRLGLPERVSGLLKQFPGREQRGGEHSQGRLPVLLKATGSASGF